MELHLQANWGKEMQGMIFFFQLTGRDWIKGSVGKNAHFFQFPAPTSGSAKPFEIPVPGNPIPSPGPCGYLHM